MKNLILLMAAFFILNIFTISDAAVFNVANVTELEAALSTASGNSEDDTINLAAGTYTVTSTLTYPAGDGQSLTIQGAGIGSTILDGGGGTQIFFTEDLGANVHFTIRGMTFQNGYTGGSTYGGVVEIDSDEDTGTVTVEDSEFIDNITSAYGALEVWAYGTITVEHCIFENNHETYPDAASGGGLMLYGQWEGDVILKNSLIINNSSTSDYGAAGGGGPMSNATEGRLR